MATSFAQRPGMIETLYQISSYCHSNTWNFSFSMMKTSVSSLFFVSVLSTLSSACNVVSDVQITFYGYPDNSPPGPDTAYNCGGRNNIAGGGSLCFFLRSIHHVQSPSIFQWPPLPRQASLHQYLP